MNPPDWGGLCVKNSILSAVEALSLSLSSEGSAGSILKTLTKKTDQNQTIVESGETTQWVRALVALPEDPGPVPSTYMVAHNCLELPSQNIQGPIMTCKGMMACCKLIQPLLIPQQLEIHYHITQLYFTPGHN